MNNEFEIPAGHVEIPRSEWGSTFPKNEDLIMAWNQVTKRWEGPLRNNEDFYNLENWAPKHFTAFARPIPKPIEITAPQGYELVPMEEWGVVPVDMRYKVFYGSCWISLSNESRFSMNHWHNIESAFKAFARPIAVPEIKPPAGFEIVYEFESLGWSPRKEDDWIYWHHPTESWCPLDTEGLSLPGFRARFTEKVGPVARPIKVTDVIKAPLPPEGYDLVPESHFHELKPPYPGWKFWGREIQRWIGFEGMDEAVTLSEMHAAGFSLIARPLYNRIPDVIKHCDDVPARPLKKDSKDPVPPEGYEMVPRSDWDIVAGPELGFKYWSVGWSVWTPMSASCSINKIVAVNPQYQYFCRPIKKETPDDYIHKEMNEHQAWKAKMDSERPATGMKDFADKLDTAQLKEPPSYKEYCKALHKEIFGEDPYAKTFQGVKIDPYRIELLYGPLHPAQAHVIKKLLRAGKSHKPLVQEIEEAMESLQRWLEMIKEDSNG